MAAELFRTIHMKIRTRIAKLAYDWRHRSLPRLRSGNPLSRASDGQDVFVASMFPNVGKRIFVEIGANDGVTISNTYHLETEHGWEGIAVEPLPEAYRKLARHRQCITVNACIADHDGSTSFHAISGTPEMLSGIFHKYDDRHKRRVRRNLKRHNATAQEITVPCHRLDTVLELYGISHIDYLSIDTEGGELDILKSIDFDAIRIELISVGNNYLTREIQDYMNSRTYCLVAIAGRDEFYARPWAADAVRTRGAG